MDASSEINDIELGNFDYRKHIIEKLLKYIGTLGAGNVIEIAKELEFYYAISYELNDYYVIGLIHKIEVLMSDMYFGDMSTD